MRVIIDESAWSDLDSIALRIARDNPSAARQEVEKIRYVIGLLGESPALSRDGRAKGTRERVVPGGRYVCPAARNMDPLYRVRLSAVEACIRGVFKRAGELASGSGVMVLSAGCWGHSPAPLHSAL